MSMKLKYSVLYLFVLFVLGCAHDDEIQSVVSTIDVAERPSWNVDLAGSDAAPSWTAPDPTKYESSMFVMVKLQEELEQYSTDKDRMTVFIDEECRAVPAKRNVDNYFLLKIRGTSTDRDVYFTLSYYCDSLHQIFNLTGKETFATDHTYGIEEEFVPPLLKGCKKYPVQTSLICRLPEDAPFSMSDDDLIAAFVGNECRGVGTVGKAFTLFRTTSGETLQLRYYSAQENTIYTLKQVVDPWEKEEITLAF